MPGDLGNLQRDIKHLLQEASDAAMQKDGNGHLISRYEEAFAATAVDGPVTATAEAKKICAELAEISRAMRAKIG